MLYMLISVLKMLKVQWEEDSLLFNMQFYTTHTQSVVVV